MRNGTLLSVASESSDTTLQVHGFLRLSHQNLSARDFAVFLVLIFVISCGSDFCYIALTRWMLRKASELKNWSGILGIVLLDRLLALILFLGPLILGALATWKLNQNLLTQIRHQGHGFPKIDPNQLAPGTVVAVMVMLAGPALNTIDFPACSLFFVLMILMLAHRLFWPALEGPIYIFQRYSLIKHKGLLVTVGVSLLFGKSLWVALGDLIGKL